MADPRFYKHHFEKDFTLSQVRSWIGGDLLIPLETREKPVFFDVAMLSTAKETDLSYFDSKAYSEQASKTQAGACLVTEALADFLPNTLIKLIVKSPKRTFARLTQQLYTLKHYDGHEGSVHPSATIHPTATVSAHVVIGPEARIGKNTFIGPFCYIGPGVHVGDDTTLESHVTAICCDVGSHTRLGSGARIGQEGFGFIMDDQGHITLPHLGQVSIGDHVRLGANTCVDRATLGTTYIENGCRLDNLIQIGHNVRIGANSVLAAQVGMGGSTTTGKHVVIGGQAGFAQHITIHDGAQIAAQSGVMHDVPERTAYGGCPALPIVQWRRQSALLKRMLKKRP